MPKNKKDMRDIETLLHAKSAEQLAKEIAEELEQQIPDPEHTLAELLEEEEKLKKQDKITADKNFRQQEERLIDLMDARQKGNERLKY
jgi:hypothetical protein